MWHPRRTVGRMYDDVDDVMDGEPPEFDEHPVVARGRTLLDEYATAVTDGDSEGAQLYLGEMMRRATMATVRLAWVSTAVAVIALVVAVVALMSSPARFAPTELSF